jgi:hypothetical protein
MPPHTFPQETGETIIARSTEPLDFMPDYLTGQRLDHFIGISDEDRLHHVTVIGRTGMGKSVLLQNLMYQDILRGNGFALIEPHGDLSRNVLDCVPAERLEDVVYVNLGDLEYPAPFNPLESFDENQHHLIASGLVSTFKRFWGTAIGPRSEYLIRNSVLALLEHPGATLLELQQLLTDEAFRERTVRTLQNPAVRHFWTMEYARYTPAFREEVIAPIQNKVGEFTTTPLIRNVVGQRKNLFQLRRLMDEGKIVIFDLSKGRIGEDAAYLLGSMIFTQLMLAAFSRQDVPESERRPFAIYADEFTNVATPSTLVTLLTEARKYRTPLVLATQLLAHLSDDLLRGAFFGVGTTVTFRTSAADADYIANEFAPVTPQQLTQLDPHHAYIKRSVNGRTAYPVSASTLPPPAVPVSYREQIIRRSREQYARPRALVERDAARHFLPATAPKARTSKTGRSGRRLPAPPSL